MGHTVVGVFKHSGDADLVAAYLRDEFVLDEHELDVIGQAEFDRLARPAQGGTETWAMAALTGIGLAPGLGDEDPVSKRWGDKVYHGETLVVARSHDPEVAQRIAEAFRRTGADHIDIIPH